jgi:hypothetical protein
MFSDEAKARYGIQVGKELIHAYGDERLMQAVTSNPAPLEGARTTMTYLAETHHWKEANNGHDKASVIRRNAAKSPGGTARTLRHTNAYDPSENSTAQHDREAWEDMVAGNVLTTGILFDSLEAPPDAPLNAEAAPDVLLGVRGDAVWLNPERIVQEILDVRDPPSRQRRFWYNQCLSTETAWVAAQDFDACANPELGVGLELLRQDRVEGRWFIFGDMSKNDDATALMGCRLHDGHLVTLGMWQKPPQGRDEGWSTPRGDVVARIDRCMAVMDVIGLWIDPSHTREDETQEQYWSATIDDLHRRYRGTLKLWAVKNKHAVEWDMASPARTAEFTAGAERMAADIESQELTHDGDPRLRIHVRNAQRYPNRWGMSIGKDRRGSQRKIDLAAAAIGARLMRRQFTLAPVESEKPRTGVVW